MKPFIRIAVSQFPVSGNIDRNRRYLQKHMREAAVKQAHIIHFPETSLPGYGPAHFQSFSGYNWNLLRQYEQEISKLAIEHNLWVIFGSMHKKENELPRNCLHVLSNNGMWISASNSSTRYSPLSSCIVRPDGTMVRYRRHKPEIIIDDFPLAELGWTYDNRFI